MVVAANWMLGAADGPTEPSRGGRASERGLDVDATGLLVDVLFDRLLDAVVIAKLTTSRIVAWNPAAEKLFGYTAQEAIGQSIEILMPEPITHIHRAGLERYMRSGHGLLMDAGTPVEMPARTKGDEQIRVELSLSELRNPRGERFAMAVVRDAMHRKRLELTNLELVQARLARSEAETELEARDDLIDAMARALSGDPSLDEVAATAAALADYRAVLAGELSFRVVDGELVDVVHAAVDAARRQASRRHLLVFTPPSVTATFDPARTRQLLAYLLGDIIDATSDGAKIELHVDQPTPQVARLRLRVPGGRTGVGVQVARALAQRQKGNLSLNTTSSGGLEAVLTLPGRPQSARRKPGRSRSRRERVSVP
jgi:PAS domain S-box-containing protein